MLLASPLHAQLLPEGYPFRRPLNFKQLPSDAPGPNAAYAEFYTNNQNAIPDQLRVTTADRILVPSKVLQSSPKDDFIRLTFETKSDGPYYVYWGNPKADPVAPEKQLDLKRGIYTEIFTPTRNARKEAQNNLDKLFESASLQGATFVPDIFLAYNPLGPEWDAMFRYSAQFKIDKPLTAEFAFSVMDSGSLSIDGKQVAHYFRDKLHGRVRDPKSLELTAGWHTINVTQTNIDGGPTGVVVAWKTPGEKNYTPLPAKLFAPIAYATAGPLEHVGSAQGGGYTADFSINPAAESFAPPDAYLQRYNFTAEFPDTFKPKLTWDYGDGQIYSGTAANAKFVSHIYLAPGPYTVTLKVANGPASFTATRRITLKDRMYSRFPKPPEDSAKNTVPVLKNYDLPKLTGEQALRGYLYLHSVSPSSGNNEADAATIAWGKAWLQTKDAPNDKILFDETFEFARMLEAQSDYHGAADAFRLASQKTSSNISLATRLNLLRYAVMTTCDTTDDAASALKEAQDALKKANDSDKNQLRIIQSAILYAAIARADNQSSMIAQAALDQLKSLTPNGGGGSGGGNFNDAQIRQGVLARNTENYIRTKDFDTALKLIDEWELDYPEALWDGFTRTLRVKLAVAEKRPLIAARLALQHAKANPNGIYAAELLYRAHENFKLANEPTQSQAALDLLKSKYPESPYARGDTKPAQ